MSVQYLKVLSSFRDATPQALLTTDEHLNALEQTWDIQATSRLLGGSSAASMVEDVHDTAKREIIYSLPVGDAGTNFYYTLVPSYKIALTQAFMYVIKFPGQRITVDNLYNGYGKVCFITPDALGNFFHYLYSHYPQESKLH